jgi:hypothetical protein
MTELDLLNLARACTANITSDLGQVITINFAMVIAIYYFLNQAKLGMKVFAFFAYMVGMLMYLGVMLEESNLKTTVLATLHSMPQEKLSPPVARYVALSDTWLAHDTSLLTNVALWVLVLGTFWLLFFWKKDAHH